MKEKFVEFAKEYGLIVVGYSGADRSIMDLLAMLQKNDDYLKGGIYWCLRRDTEVSEELKKLLWKDRSYFVEIDGFDEFFASVYADLHGGETLPVSALSVSRRPNEIVGRLLESELMFPQTNAVLRDAKERLTMQSKRLAIAESFVEPNPSKPSSFESSGFTEDEMLMVSSVQRLLENNQYQKCIDAARTHINKGLRKAVHRQLLRLIINGHRLSGNQAMAVNACDELISLQPGNAANYLLKAASCLGADERFKTLLKAVEVNQHSVQANIDIARYYSACADKAFGTQYEDFKRKSLDHLKKATEIDPSVRNVAWRELLHLYQRDADSCVEDKEGIKAIIATVTKQDPYSFRVLSLRCETLDQKTPPAEVDQLIKDLATAERRLNDDEDTDWIELRLNIYDRTNRVDELRSELQDISSKLENAHDPDLAVTVSRVLRKRLGADERAVEIMQYAIKRFDFDPTLFRSLYEALFQLGRFTDAADLMKRHGHEVVPQFREKMLHEFYVSTKEYDKAIAAIRRWGELTGLRFTNRLLYVLLLQGNYKEAETTARAFLDEIAYSHRAVAEIVNFEIARKHNGRKPDVARLEGVLAVSSNSQTRAAVYAVLGRRAEAISAAKQAVRIDYAFRYAAREWPAFDEIRDDPDFVKNVIEVRAI